MVRSELPQKWRVAVAAGLVAAAQLGTSGCSTTPTRPAARMSAPDTPVAERSLGRRVADNAAARLTTIYGGEHTNRMLDARKTWMDGVPPLSQPVREFFSPDHAAFGWLNDHRALRSRQDRDGNAVLLYLQQGNPFSAEPTPVYGLLFMKQDGLAYPLAGTLNAGVFAVETKGNGLPAWEAEVPADGMRYTTTLSRALTELRRTANER